MKAGKTSADRARAAADMAARRRKVAAFLHARVPQQDMARALEVSIATICRDVKAVLADWQADQNIDAGAAVAQELATLDADEMAFRQQLGALRQKDAQLLEKGTVLVTALTMPSQLGIYDRIFRIMERRAKLLGLDAPTVLRVQGDKDNPLVMQAIPPGLSAWTDADLEAYAALLAKLAPEGAP